MEKFITHSEASKKILNIAQMSSSLPVNVLIIGELGVGKTILSKHILHDSPVFEARVLEEMIIKYNFNKDEYTELIVLNLDRTINKQEFMDRLSGIKIVATTSQSLYEIDALFAIKIDIPPLNERPEDLEELTQVYIKKANKIYNTNVELKDIKIDLTQNGISLKKVIYKTVSSISMDDNEMMDSLEYFINKKLEENQEYRDLLKYFEIPLLKAAKTQYKSQLQMATRLNINRITLRKKLELYSKDLV